MKNNKRYYIYVPCIFVYIRVSRKVYNYLKEKTNLDGLVCWYNV